MRKILLTLIAFTTLCAMNVWGDITWDIVGTELSFTYSGSGSRVLEAVDFNVEWNTEYNRSHVTSIVIDEGVESIEAYAFNNFVALQSFTAPSTLKSIGNHAFMNCAKTNAIHAYSPNTWASITFGDQWSTPFGTTRDISVESCDFYFYGNESNSTYVVFTAGLTSISQYAFFRATSITEFYIPGTVTSIGDHALDCSITNLYVNKKKAPSKGTSSITWQKSGTTLYVPKGAQTSYKAMPYYNSTNNSTTGAKNIGTSGDHSSVKASGIGSTGNTYITNGSFDNIKWSLDTVGTLLLEGHGSVSTNYTGSSYNSATNLPWGRFRRLVNKAVIKAKDGDITALNTVLRYHYALDTIILEQTTIPTHSYIISTTNNTANNFDQLLDQRKNVVLKIKVASLTDETTSLLGTEPWKNAKLDIALSENLVINDNGNYKNVLDSCKKYVELPFNLQTNRSLTDAQYNTFCLPVPLTAEQLNSADIRALETSTLEGYELTLYFSTSSLDAIEAGKPYLIQPSEALSAPTFTDVNPSTIVSSPINATTKYVDFMGVLAPTQLTGGDENTLFLGAGNELLWPAVGSENKIKGMRAYFELKDAARNAVKAHITMNPNHTTDFEDVQNDKVQRTKVLRNGQIYLMYEGQMYDVHGRRIQ